MKNAKILIAAILFLLVLLGLISQFHGLFGFEKSLVASNDLFRGFSGNAVIAIIAVMIIGAGANLAVFALTVALATSNSFFLPTHQVNALLMGPGGYRVADYMRAGGIMTVLFIVVLMVMLSIVF